MAAQALMKRGKRTMATYVKVKVNSNKLLLIRSELLTDQSLKDEEKSTKNKN